MIGDTVRKLRVQKAFSQEELAYKAKIGLDTLSDIERGVRTPQGRTIRKLASALGVSPEDLTSLINSPRPQQTICQKVCVKLTRFIPLYIGHQNNVRHIRRNQENADQNIDRSFKYFEDGFLVIAETEYREYGSIIDALIDRRESHIKTQNKKDSLSESPPSEEKHPIFSDVSPGIDYVMSTYQLCNPQELSDAEIFALCKPSLVGITDDSKQTICSKEEARQNLSMINPIPSSCNVQIIPSKDSCFYVSWSNVVLTDSNENSSDFQRLADLEIELQKYWYQINMYDTYLDQCICSPNHYNMEKVLHAVKIALLGISGFCKVDSIGAGHINELKKALIETSHIKEIVESLNDKVKMI